MASSSSTGQRVRFFPKADAAVLSLRHGPAPSRSHTVAPIYDRDNVDQPIGPWPRDAEQSIYPPKTEPFAPASIPEKPSCPSSRYLRAYLAKNERLRLSMLWYYTRAILDEPEFLSGLQEKVHLAQESTDWEFAIIGVLDMNYYIRLATIGVEPTILPRGETICAHTVTQPPGSIFLLPNTLEDWRFQQSPYTESGGLRAYAGAPLRLQNEAGECVGLGSLCVASSTSKEPLNKVQQQTLVRLADWVVSDIVQCARARRQRERRRMAELIATVQKESDNDRISEQTVFAILESIYPEAVISLQSSRSCEIEVEGRVPVLLSDFEDGVWEDIEYIGDFITNNNHLEPPDDKVVRIITAQCESVSGPSLLVVASKDFRLIFDDVDSWFVQTCAGILSQMWHKRLLAEALIAKEKFLRGFSHQLRTPIHGILGSVELLAEELKQKSLGNDAYPFSTMLERNTLPKASEPSVYLDTIKVAGRDLVSIVNSMITLNRWADIAVAERCYTEHTINDFEMDLASEVEKTLSGDSRYNASVIFQQCRPQMGFNSLRIDLELLRNCLFPLIMNAIQNTPVGVVAISISLCPNSKELTIDIEDTGCGIELADHQRIFEPYEKVHVHSSGAGLGLTLASKFATLLHGSIRLVSSDIGRGSHFRATFREVECTQPSASSKTLVSTLKNISPIFHSTRSNTNCSALQDRFTTILINQGFTSSETAQGGFALIDFENEMDHILKLPTDQVAICAVPASERANFAQEATGNVVYIRAPFLTTAIVSAIEEVDRRAEFVKPSCDGFPTVPPPVTQGDDDSTTDQFLRSPNNLSQPLASRSLSPNLSHQANKATLTKRLPNSSASALVHAKISVPLTQRRSSKPATLLVDDNVINLRIMQMYCSKRGLPVYCAKDGKEAIEIFSRQQASSASGEVASIELVLMDLQMPVCDGIEATREIRALEIKNQWAESTIFIVSGQDSPADREAADGAGADDYYVKPVSMKTLDNGLKQYFPEFQSK